MTVRAPLGSRGDTVCVLYVHVATARACACDIDEAHELGQGTLVSVVCLLCIPELHVSCMGFFLQLHEVTTIVVT